MGNITIAPSEVARRIDDDSADDLFVLDVRTEDDHDEWRIDGSTNVPVYHELLTHDYSTLESYLDDLPEDEEIATVCVAGVTSARAAEFLREHGFDAKSVEGGMNSWDRIDRPNDGEDA